MMRLGIDALQSDNNREFSPSGTGRDPNPLIFDMNTNNKVSCTKSVHVESNQNQSPRTPQKRRRNSVLQEICTTESHYIHDLCLLHDFYIVPLLEQRHIILQNAQIAVFFSQIAQLITLHRKLSNDLYEALQHKELLKSNNPCRLKSSQSFYDSKYPVYQGIGAIFCRFAGLFAFHGAYAKDYDKVVRSLYKYRQDPKLGLQSFLQKCQTESASDQTFDSLLIKPIQRIPRYKLLLERLHEYTPSDHADAWYLSEAVKRVTQATSNMNATIAAQANLETMIATQQRFKGQISLLSGDRMLVMTGNLLKLMTRQPMSMHLFNDLLICSEILGHDRFRISSVFNLQTSGLKVRIGVELNGEEIPKDVMVDRVLCLQNHSQWIFLYALTNSEARQWASAIVETQCAAQKRAVCESDVSGIGWVNDIICYCKLCHISFKMVFRRHHCHRCGAVVCSECSKHKCVVLDQKAGENGKERVCDHCFAVLELAKCAAMRWKATIVRYCGVLDRMTGNGRKEYYFELVCDTLKQYSLDREKRKKSVISLRLAGAIVIHRSDSDQNCFEISCGYVQPPNLCRRLSGTEYSDTESTLSENSNIQSHCASWNKAQEEMLWVLYASDADIARNWSKAIQCAANKALEKLKHQQSTTDSASVLMELVFKAQCDEFEETGDSGSEYSSASCVDSNQLYDSEDEHSYTEKRRSEIVERLLCSEERYANCLGECIRVYIQPLLLRQLENEKRVQELGSKRSWLSSHSRNAEDSQCGEDQGKRKNRIYPRIFRSGSLNGHLSLIQQKNRVLNQSLGSIQDTPRYCASWHGGMSQEQTLPLFNADLAVFFSTLNHIYTLNQQLVDHLSRHVLQVGSSQELRPGAIFDVYAPLFDLYITYAERHRSAMDMITSPAFSEYLSDISKDMDRFLRYLQMPMHRMPRYQKHMQRLLACTSRDHLDYVWLQSAASHVDNIILKIEKAMQRQLNAQKIEHVSASTGMFLAGRVFVKCGILRKVGRVRIRKFNVFLFEDALAFGRKRSALHKAKYKMIQLWECRVSDQTDATPLIIHGTLAKGMNGSENAFYLYSPFKSFILLSATKELKKEWMDSIQRCIDLTGNAEAAMTSSAFTERLLNTSDVVKPLGNLVIKNGWLNVVRNPFSKRCQRLWICLTMQTIALSSNVHAAQPLVSLQNACCEVLYPEGRELFGLCLYDDPEKSKDSTKRMYVFETESQSDREEWIRALTLCISNCDSSALLSSAIALRRQSTKSSNLAPILMFNKASNVCTICYHSFTLYRRRHHCRFCGSLVCHQCSRRKWNLSRGQSKKASRICDICVQSIQNENCTQQNEDK